MYCYFLVSPGLLDFSPEEIRLEAYKANAEGKADVYVSGSNRVSAVEALVSGHPQGVKKCP